MARFRDTVGRVKTVNMNGRALVEFDEYHLNIGWYDIDPEYLKVVDAPLPPKPKEAAPPKPPQQKSRPARELQRAGAHQPSPNRPRAAAGKPSVADILAAPGGMVVGRRREDASGRHRPCQSKPHRNRPLRPPRKSTDRR